MLDWRRRYGRLPSSYDWSRTHAAASGGGVQATHRRRVACVERGHPALRHLGCRSRRGFAAKRGGADTPAVGDVAIGQSTRSRRLIPGESTAKSQDLRGGAAEPQRGDLQGFSVEGRISPIIRVGEVPGSNPGAPIENLAICRPSTARGCVETRSSLESRYGIGRWESLRFLADDMPATAGLLPAGQSQWLPPREDVGAPVGKTGVKAG